MRRAKAAGAVVVGAAIVVLLAGCFGPTTDELLRLAHSDFEMMVDRAAEVDATLLHTLEVEPPSEESCDREDSPDARHTVLVSAGTMAIGTRAVQEGELLTDFEPLFDDPERWTEVDSPGQQRTYVGVEGITASVTIEDGLLVMAVFTPCR